MTMFRLKTILIIAILWPFKINAQNSLRDVVTNRAELSTFADVLQGAGLLDTLLDDPNQSLTLFAPTNQALQSSKEFREYLNGFEERPAWWKEHLRAAALNHIVNQTISAVSVSSLVPIKSMYGTIARVPAFHESDIEASNGILHLVNGILRPQFFNELLMQRQSLPSEFGPEWPSMFALAESVGGMNEFRIVRRTGSTFAGCSAKSFDKIGRDHLTQSINGASVMNDEIRNASFSGSTKRNFIDYTIIPENIYYGNLPEDFEALVSPVANCADMWITKRNGKLCFNDGCVEDIDSVGAVDKGTSLASNGVRYIIDRCLFCPGIGLMTGYAAEYTSNNVSDISKFLIASGWNLRDLSKSIGDGSALTFFASSDSLADDDVMRLLSSRWKPHLLDFLMANIVQGEYSGNTLASAFLDGGGMTSFRSLSGDSFWLKENDVVRAGIRGVDGFVHVVAAPVVPKSLMWTLYDLVDSESKYSIYTLSIEQANLKGQLSSHTPTTAFFVPNDSFETNIFARDTIPEPVLKNHLFHDLYFCEDLIGFGEIGAVLEAISGQKYRIIVSEDRSPCFVSYSSVQNDEPTTASCITKCNMLSKNGVAHEIERLIPGATNKNSPSPSIMPSQLPSYKSSEPPSFESSEQPSFAPSESASSDPSLSLPFSITMSPSLSSTEIESPVPDFIDTKQPIESPATGTSYSPTYASSDQPSPFHDHVTSVPTWDTASSFPSYIKTGSATSSPSHSIELAPFVTSVEPSTSPTTSAAQSSSSFSQMPSITSSLAPSHDSLRSRVPIHTVQPSSEVSKSLTPSIMTIPPSSVESKEPTTEGENIFDEFSLPLDKETDANNAVGIQAMRERIRQESRRRRRRERMQSNGQPTRQQLRRRRFNNERRRKRQRRPDQ